MFNRSLTIRFAVIVTLLVVATLAVAAPEQAKAQVAALASPAHTYAGTYAVGGQNGTVSITLVRGIGRGMYEGTAKIDGKKYYSNEIFQNGVVYINIFRLDANYNQKIIATMQGTISPDFTTITGPFTLKGTVGTATLTAK